MIDAIRDLLIIVISVYILIFSLSLQDRYHQMILVEVFPPELERPTPTSMPPMSGPLQSLTDLRKISGLTKEKIDQALSGTELEGLGAVFVEVERDYKVNAKFLVALAVLESSWGRSHLATKRNNLFGFAAYDGVISGGAYFESKEHCIKVVTKYLAREYLTDTGKWHSGYKLVDVSRRYSRDKQWTGKIVSISKKLFERDM